MVEGGSDKNAIIHIMMKLGWHFDEISPIPKIKEYGGFSLMKTSIKTALQSNATLGFVCDANGNPEKRLAEVRSEFERHEDVSFSTLKSGGLLGLTPKGKKRGIWMMPSPDTSGQIENLLASFIPEEERLWKYAQLATREARTHGASYRDQDTLPSELHTWLAWQIEPGLSYGQAIKTNILRPSGDSVIAFKEWFNELFEEPQPK